MGDELEKLLEGVTLDELLCRISISHPIYLRIKELEERLKAAEEVVLAVKFGLAMNSFGHLETVIEKYEEGK